MCFEFYNMTSYSGKRCLQESMNVWPRRFFIVPTSALLPAMCALIHLNAIILEKWTHKNMQFEENGVKKS